MTQRIHKATNPFSKQSEMLTAEEYENVEICYES